MFRTLTLLFDLFQRGLDDTNVSQLGVNNQSLLLKLSQAHGSDATKVLSKAFEIVSRMLCTVI